MEILLLKDSDGKILYATRNPQQIKEANSFFKNIEKKVDIINIDLNEIIEQLTIYYAAEICDGYVGELETEKEKSSVINNLYEISRRYTERIETLPYFSEDISYFADDIIRENKEEQEKNKLLDEPLEVIEVLDRECLFTEERLNKSDLPEGLYCYDLREGDEADLLYFATIEPKVVVNRAGTIITNEPIDFGTDGYIAFEDEDDTPNFKGEILTIREFFKK